MDNIKCVLFIKSLCQERLHVLQKILFFLLIIIFILFLIDNLNVALLDVYLIRIFCEEKSKNHQVGKWKKEVDMGVILVLLHEKIGPVDRNK